jgi:hypothetical protein
MANLVLASSRRGTFGLRWERAAGLESHVRIGAICGRIARIREETRRASVFRQGSFDHRRGDGCGIAAPRSANGDDAPCYRFQPAATNE